MRSLRAGRSPRRAAAEISAERTSASRVTARASSGRSEACVDVHEMGEQLLVERAPIGADPHRLAVFDREFDDRGELPVLLFLEADIARIDAVFGERLAAGRMIGEQLVADIMEIADERDVASLLREPVANMRHGGRRFVAIDGDAHEFRALPAPAPAPASRSTRHRPCRCWSWTGRRSARRRRRSPRRGQRQPPPRSAPAGRRFGDDRVGQTGL